MPMSVTTPIACPLEIVVLANSMHSFACACNDEAGCIRHTARRAWHRARRAKDTQSEQTSVDSIHACSSQPMSGFGSSLFITDTASPVRDACSILRVAVLSFTRRISAGI